MSEARRTHWGAVCAQARAAVDAADPDWKLGPGDRGDVHVVVRALSNELLAIQADRDEA